MNRNTKPAHQWNIADSFTAARIVISVFLLFIPMHTPWFLGVYTVAGLTDVVDGWIARKTDSSSDFGARLDSVADLTFYTITVLRLLPVLIDILPGAIWYGVVLVLLVRLASYLTAAVKFHRFASMHTWLNKLTGGAVFLLPYLMALSLGHVYCWVIFALGLLASVEELLIHLCRKDYRTDRRSILQRDSRQTGL